MNQTLITVGVGFIGSRIARRYVNSYEDIYAYSLDALSGVRNLKDLIDIEYRSNYSFLKGDITDELVINPAFEGRKCDSIIHIAAKSHADCSLTDPSPLQRECFRDSGAFECI